MDEKAKERLEEAKRLVREGKIVIPEGAQHCLPVRDKKDRPKEYEFVYCRPQFFGPHKGNNGGVIIQWGCKGVGFGEVALYLDKDNTLKLDTECMNDKFIEALFQALRKNVQRVG